LNYEQCVLLLRDLWERTGDPNWVYGYAKAIEDGEATLFGRKLIHTPAGKVSELTVTDDPDEHVQEQAAA
jgi:hypothetical protein